MNISERDRRALTVLLPALLISAIVYFWPEPSTAPKIIDTAAAIETARLRLDLARLTAAQLPSRLDARKAADTDLAAWEKRLISADSPAQAQAQLLQVFRRIVRLQGNAAELRGNDIGTVAAIPGYTEISLTVSLDCQIEGLVNLLADLSAQPELLAWRDLRISSSDPKLKRLNVVMVFLGYAPQKLIPRATGAARG